MSGDTNDSSAWSEDLVPCSTGRGLLRRFRETPAATPSSCENLTSIALALRERVQLGPHQLFRLVGVGLSNFQSGEDKPTPLFDGEQSMGDSESAHSAK